VEDDSASSNSDSVQLCKSQSRHSGPSAPSTGFRVDAESLNPARSVALGGPTVQMNLLSRAPTAADRDPVVKDVGKSNAQGSPHTETRYIAGVGVVALVSRSRAFGAVISWLLENASFGGAFNCPLDISRSLRHRVGSGI
jgi:hypothetical protein